MENKNTKILYCPFLCKKETLHKLIGKRGFMCLTCGVEFKEVYCHVCSKAGGANMPIYHLPPICEEIKDENSK